MALSMRENQSDDDYFASAERRKRTWRIVIAHALVVATFFIATFLWGNFQ